MMIIALMLAGLVLAAVLPRAFDSTNHALVFIATYCSIQIGRSLGVPIK